MAQVSIIRIVVASPNDVMPEREALEEVVSEINLGIARKFGFRLELIKCLPRLSSRWSAGTDRPNCKYRRKRYIHRHLLETLRNANDERRFRDRT